MEKLTAQHCGKNSSNSSSKTSSSGAGSVDALYLAKLVERFNSHLENYLQRYGQGPPRLLEAMAYSLLTGGKRVRPMLVILSCQCCGGQELQAMPAAAAIEMVHTFSLIHDDLPAMDNDDLRRGRPTNHKVFGQAMAILAGDALLALAFELLAKQVQDPARASRQIYQLAHAAGLAGMTGGQALDIDYQGQADLDTIEQVHTSKTAALISCACKLGALAADADDRAVNALGKFGLYIGRAFQILDDLLDIRANSDQAGKRTGKDASLGRPNYAVIAGKKDSMTRAEQLFDQAVAELTDFGHRADRLTYLAGKLMTRNN